MRLTSLFSLFILFTGCNFAPEEKNQFSGGREKMTKKRARETQENRSPAPPVVVKTTQTAQPAVPGQKTSATVSESLILPFKFSAGHKSVLLKSADHKRISFSAAPNTEPVRLIAGLSGKLSLKTQNGFHYLSLTPNQGSQTLHFELSESASTVETSDQAEVKQKQLLMTSSKPIVFYIQSDSEVNVICLNTSGLEKVLKVVKELPDTADCPK